MNMQTEAIDCPLCGVAGELAFSEDGWDANTCPACRLLFLSPRPTAAAVASIYQQDSAHVSAIMHLHHFGASVNKLSAAKTLRLLKKYRRSGRLLEIGPGGGSLLVAARDAGYEVAGVELNPTQLEHIRSLDIQCWSSMEAAEGPFDIVYHRDVASHFFDPLLAFEQIGRLLADDGLHVFETGEGDISEKYRPLIANWQFPDHLFIYSDEALRRLLQRTGYESIRIERYSIAPLLRAKAAYARAKGRTSKAGPSLRSSEPGSRSRARRAAITALGYSRHFLQYGLGSLTPRSGRPQTVIVVARKVNG